MPCTRPPRRRTSGRTGSRNSTPVIAPAPEAETEEQAEQRRQQYEAQRKAHEEEQDRRAEERRMQEKREEQEREAEFAKRDELRKQREKTFEQIVAQASANLSPAQLRVILRAIVNLDPYTFADDLATDLSEDPDNDKRSAEEVLLTVIDGTADDKLTSFAVRLALAGHRGIPRETELDFLTKAAAAFLTPKPKKNPAKKTALAKVKEPTPIKLHKAAAKKAGTKRTSRSPTRTPSQPNPVGGW